jgi:putative ABC transport system permease protein
MKYFPLVWAGLWRKRVRTGVTFVCIVVAFVLMGTLKGIAGGLNAIIEGFSDARLRVQSKVNLTQPLPLAMRGVIEQIPGVRRVGYAASFGGFYQDPKNPLVSSALDLPSFLEIYPEILLPPEQRKAVLETPTAALVGAELAERFGWKVGDRVPVQSRFWARADGSKTWTFDVMGIYRVKNTAVPAHGFFVSFRYFDEARAMANGLVNQFLVQIESPEAADRVSQQIDAAFANSANETITQSEKTYLRVRLGQIGDIGFFVNAVAGAMLFLLLALTINVMMQSVRERIPELAVLRALGYGDMQVTSIVFSEALLMCTLAALLGLALASMGFPLVLRGLGFGIVPMPTSVIALGLIVAATLAVVSSAQPLWSLTHMSIVSGLRRA